MPTAYLSPSLLQDLTNVSVSPGAGNTGYPLVWNNASGRFELAVLGVTGGGTGTSNGSITGTGALTFAAGGTNQSITLSPASGNTNYPNGGFVETTRPLVIKSSVNAKLIFESTNTNSTSQNGILWQAPNSSSDSFYVFNNLDGFYWFNNTQFRANFYISKGNTVGFGNYSGLGAPVASGVLEVLNSSTNTPAFRVTNTQTLILSNTASTSTTTGACVVSGGLGVAGAIHGGSSLTLASDASAAQPAIVAGTNNGLKIGTATSQKLGFFNATPVVQQAAVADATDAASTQARLNDLLARLRSLGLIAT